MKHLMITLALMALVTTASFASTMPVAGTTSGTWETPTGGGVPSDIWLYAGSPLDFLGFNNVSYVMFDGATFSGTTTYSDVLLGTIYLNNGVLLDGNGIYDNSLDFRADFTVPGGNLSFVFPLEVQASWRPLLGGGNDVLLNLGGAAGQTQSMTVGGYTYTLTLDGFFQYNPDQTQVTQINDNFELVDWNSPAHANLYGEFTSVSVPDAGFSVMLLGGALLGIEILRRRFRA